MISELRWIVMTLALVAAACGTSRRYAQADPPYGYEYYLSIFGDSRDGNDIYSLLQRHSLVAGRPRATVHLGDMISNSQSAEQWPTFVSLTQTYGNFKTFFPVIGNHDVTDAASLELFLATFPQVPRPGYMSERIGECFCIFLNSEDLEILPGRIGPTQLSWLQHELESPAAHETACRLVFAHRPPFPQNHHRDEPLEPAETLHQLFQTNHVAAVIASHEHSYSRIQKDNVMYVISGGAGSPLYQPAGPKSAFYHYVQVSYLKNVLRFRIIDYAGRIRDDFEVEFDSPDPGASGP